MQIVQAERAKEFGAAESQANQQLAGGGVAFIIGNIVLCGGSDLLRLRPIFTQFWAFCGLASATLIMLFVDSYLGLLSALLMFTFMAAATLGLCHQGFVQVLGSEEQSVHALGHCMLWNSFPILAGPPTAGECEQEIVDFSRKNAFLTKMFRNMIM